MRESPDLKLVDIRQYTLNRLVDAMGQLGEQVKAMNNRYVRIEQEVASLRQAIQRGFAEAADRSEYLNTAIVVALINAIEAAGLASCEVFGGPGTTVHGSDYEADAVVTLCESPTIVVDVLSGGTTRVDTTQKLADYFTEPSIRHYLVFSPRQRKVAHYRKLDSARSNIATRIISNGDIVLDPPGLTIALEPLYRRVLP